MKKSHKVQASLIAAVAAALAASGCNDTMRECRDEKGNLLPSTDCSSGRRSGAHWVSIPRTSSGGFGRTGSSGSSGGFFGG